ncbi:MAG: nucleotidyl transferase AbiEii/AbiGii toxin family protein [Candidatus Eisenbacteria bacterium]|mgnify:CR=1 FL=1|nr:nucleotidyl transferase AbiEii/AbiGii toxin family protein [Candidatus Eisenbacteria bacterium]
MDFEKLLALLRELERHGVDYMVVGGIALTLHGIVRATEDIDLFVRAEATNVEKLKDALRAVWPDPEIDQIRVADLSGDYPTVRYVPPDGGPVVDILARLGTAFSFDDLESETAKLEGITVRVATPETLYRMKKDTLRLIDKADAEALRKKFGLES